MTSRQLHFQLCWLCSIDSAPWHTSNKQVQSAPALLCHMTSKSVSLLRAQNQGCACRAGGWQVKHGAGAAGEQGGAARAGDGVHSGSPGSGSALLRRPPRVLLACPCAMSLTFYEQHQGSRHHAEKQRCIPWHHPGEVHVPGIKMGRASGRCSRLQEELLHACQIDCAHCCSKCSHTAQGRAK